MKTAYEGLKANIRSRTVLASPSALSQNAARRERLPESRPRRPL